jgi:hypothetical protein
MRVTWADGTVTTYAAFSCVKMDREPVKIEGHAVLLLGPRVVLETA